MTNLNENTITLNEVKELVIFFGNEVIYNKPYLTELDSAIGDGDHGIGMEVGFKNGIKAIEENQPDNINEIFLELGKAMINNMGGASGIIFGTLFLSDFKNREVMTEITLAELTNVFEYSLEAIKQRGKASLGDKTIIDAFEPAINGLKKGIENNASLADAFKLASEEAKKGVENTKNLVAKFGRAKSLGERSLGHQDAGATTISIIFKSIATWLEKRVVSNV